jgi:anhydro-N-acetylmuramic acid kinase
VEYFNIAWLYKHMAERRSGDDSTGTGTNASQKVLPGARDIQATLSELTARSIAAAVGNTWACELLVCGGGVHNLDLLERLQRLLPDTRVDTTRDSGIDPDLVEAVLFAWLARERIANRALDTRRITGAREPVLLGEIFDPA